VPDRRLAAGRPLIRASERLAHIRSIELPRDLRRRSSTPQVGGITIENPASSMFD
jgi:hypothetical protein